MNDLDELMKTNELSCFPDELLKGKEIWEILMTYSYRALFQERQCAAGADLGHWRFAISLRDALPALTSKAWGWHMNRGGKGFFVFRWGNRAYGFSCFASGGGEPKGVSMPLWAARRAIGKAAAVTKAA